MTFWHMSLADLINSGYIGVNADAEVPGVNIAKSSYTKYAYNYNVADSPLASSMPHDV